MVNTLNDGATFLTALSLRIEGRSKTALKKAARMLRDEARAVLGTYEYDWPSLAESTIARKKLGDSPGLETGAMRASIRFSVSGHEATIGSNDPKLLWFELGTIHMPPRSVLAETAHRHEREVQEICGKKVFEQSFVSFAPDFEDEWSYDGED